MATPGGLKFLNDIQNRNVLQVQLAMRKGHANPNRNYLNVFPLNLAIEQVCRRAIDRVAVRLGGSSAAARTP